MLKWFENTWQTVNKYVDNMNTVCQQIIWYNAHIK